MRRPLIDSSSSKALFDSAGREMECASSCHPVLSGGSSYASEHAALPHELLRELQETGLLEFMKQGFLDPAYFADDLTSCADLSPAHVYDLYDEHTAKRAKYFHPGSHASLHESQEMNRAADKAVARASSKLCDGLSKLKQLSYQAQGCKGVVSGVFEDSPPRSKRKVSRQSNESCSGRMSSKGLRHFSMRVCSKVESKGRTTYNEVADELVTELSRDSTGDDIVQYDEKNIRRRVYDAINVLMAMDVIEKEKKEIIWKGFPCSKASVVESSLRERRQLLNAVERKRNYLKELIEQQRALKTLLAKNPDRRSNTCGTALPLPFVLVQAKPEATVEVKISEDMLDVQFDFYNCPFEIHDDSYVLRNLLKEKNDVDNEKQSSADTVTQVFPSKQVYSTKTDATYNFKDFKNMANVELMAQHSGTFASSPLRADNYVCV